MNVHTSTMERAAARWRDRSVVVVGAGRSGVAAARLLLDCGANVTITDLRPLEQLTEAVPLAGRGVQIVSGGHPVEIWSGADAAVFSPGIPPRAAVVEQAACAGVEILAEIDVAAGFIEAPIIAITGSNGKSTVTSMIGEAFAAAGVDAAVCGNIGTAISAAVRRQLVEGARFEAYVVEVSSFQAYAIEDFHPQLAAILNIQPDHLDWHGSMDDYAAAKLRLSLNMTAADHLVYNTDDNELQRRSPAGSPRLVPFGRRPTDPCPPAAWVGTEQIWWWPEDGPRQAIMRLESLGVIGPHNESNACAAAALTALYGLPVEAIAAGLSGYRALEHRMEDCGRVDGIRCINDSKATNVDATLAALSGFERGVWLILGGRDKDADFGQLLPLLDDRVVRVLLIGEAADAIAAALEPTRRVERCETLETAVERALSDASPGATLLLSPACTSFDQFPNFEERGRHFKALVAAAGTGSEEPAGNARET